MVDFRRQQRRRRQEQVTRLLRPEVGLRREWVSTPRVQEAPVTCLAIGPTRTRRCQSLSCVLCKR
jgi:hypothetical protein